MFGAKHGTMQAMGSLMTTSFAITQSTIIAPTHTHTHMHTSSLPTGIEQANSPVRKYGIIALASLGQYPLGKVTLAQMVYLEHLLHCCRVLRL